MSKGQLKRKKLFKIFAQNLDWFKEHPSVQFKPDFSNRLMCPICTDIFSEKDLLAESENPLTIEHVPPESLGGKARLLTCKKCNSLSGHVLDNNLLKSLLEFDFESFLPNSWIKTTFKLNGNQINGTVKIDEKGTFIIDVNSKISDPKQAKLFMNEVVLPKTYYSPISFNFDEILESQQLTAKFSFAHNKKANTRKAEVALLRIAYLYACAHFGHGFFINPCFGKVRQQILKPDQNIITSPFWIPYTDLEEGVHLIKEPKELQGFLVVFSLKTPSITRKYAIALPGFSNESLKIYENIGTIIGTKAIEMTVDYLNEVNYLEKKEYTFYSSVYWQRMINSETNK